jgi:hypothetical protein
MTNDTHEVGVVVDVVTADKLEEASTEHKFNLCQDCLQVLRERFGWLHALYVSEEGHIYPAQIVKIELGGGYKYGWDYAWARNTLCSTAERLQLLGQTAWFFCSNEILHDNGDFIRYLVEHDSSLLNTPLDKQALPERTLTHAIMLYKLSQEDEK